jgi:putative endopeptidase
MNHFSRLTKKILPVGLAVCAILGTTLLMAQKADAPAFDKQNMDLTQRPGDDFYRFTNGAWIKNFNLPDDRSSYDAFDQVREQNRDLLHALCESMAKEAKTAKPGSPAQKIGDFYAMAMDIDAIEKLGAQPLREDLDRIAKLTGKQDLLDLLADFHRGNLSILFGGGVEADLANSKATTFYFGQGGLGLPDRDYYIKEDADAQNLRKEYLVHVAKMLGLIGHTPEQAETAAQVVMSIETRLAKASKTNVEMRDIPNLYNKMSLAQLQDHCPDIDWSRYFKTIAGREIPEVIVMSPLFYKELGLMVKEVSLADWQAYLRWHLSTSYAGYLSSAFVNENFRFYGQVMEGTKTIQDRWKRMTNMTSGYLGELMGQIYAEKYFPPAAKQRMVELAANIKKAFETRLKNVTWMGETTKKQALEKLAAMKVEVGYPDKWQDYTKLEVKRDGFLANVKRHGRFAFEKNLDEYGKPADPTKWDMTPQTVNAGYNPIFNRMTFPAGILQPPFFFMNADDAMNYGAIGMAIGHEMSHGFDDQGRNFDKDGNLRNWWTPEDAEQFKKLTQILVDQYGSFTAVGDVKVNGELSLGEAIADVAGLTVSYEAYRLSLAGKEPAPIDGLSGGQRFFMAFAQLWRGKIRDEALRRMVVGDVHPWGEFRVNGAPFNVPAFYELFDIKPTDKLYRKPADRAVIW